jgi:hypothetical protein
MDKMDKYRGAIEALRTILLYLYIYPVTPDAVEEFCRKSAVYLQAKTVSQDVFFERPHMCCTVHSR